MCALFLWSWEPANAMNTPFTYSLSLQHTPHKSPPSVSDIESCWVPWQGEGFYERAFSCQDPTFIKKRFLVHSVYLFCVEKSRAIKHEDVHPTLFHLTLLSTTLYRVWEWIFNIVPQNASGLLSCAGALSIWSHWGLVSDTEHRRKRL